MSPCVFVSFVVVARPKKSKEVVESPAGGMKAGIRVQLSVQVESDEYNLEPLLELHIPRCHFPIM